MEEDEGERFNTFEARRRIKICLGNKTEKLVVEALGNWTIEIADHD